MGEWLRMVRLRLKRRGFGLLVILAIGVVLSAFTAVIGFSAAASMRTLTSQGLTDQAHYAAFSGLQAGLYRLSQDPSVSDVDAAGNPDTFLLTFANPDVTCLVIIYNNTPVAVHRSASTPDGTPIPDGKVYIASAGRIYNQNKTESASLAALASSTAPQFDNAVFGDVGVTNPDSLIDAYSSSASPYAPYDMTNAALQKKKAPIGSNSSSAGAISLGHSAQVDGKALAGVGSTATSVVSLDPSALLTDGLSSLASRKKLPAFTLPASPTQSWASGLSLDGSSLLLNGGGTYVVNGALQLKNHASLMVSNTGTGKAIVYVTSSVDIGSGSTLNTGGAPDALQIYVLGASSGGPQGTFQMNGGSSGSLVVAGGDLQATLAGGSEVFGALLGQQVTLSGNSKLHFDADLTTKPLGSGSWKIDSTVSVAPVTAPPPGGTGGNGSTTTGTTTGSTSPGTTTGTSSGTTGTANAGTNTGTTTGTATSGTTTSGSTTGGCCGCGCGGGSAMMQML